jgi:hypothetical protein
VSKFITEEVDAIKVEGDPNTIYIRRRLNMGQIQRVQSAAAMAAQGVTNDAGIVGAMWAAYVARWEGPDFKGLKPNQHNFDQLDPDDPLVEAVSDAIAARWSERGKSDEAGEAQAKN